jgi:hypothetical protein
MSLIMVMSSRWFHGLIMVMSSRWFHGLIMAMSSLWFHGLIKVMSSGPLTAIEASSHLAELSFWYQIIRKMMMYK